MRKLGFRGRVWRALVVVERGDVLAGAGAKVYDVAPVVRLLFHLLAQAAAGRFAEASAMLADPEVMRFLGGPQSETEAEAVSRRIADHWAEHGFGLWAVEVVETGTFAGFTGLSRPGFDAPFAPAVEVGWRLAREAWGRGYATEAARAAAGYGFGAAGLEEIVSFTAVANVRSRAVMERLGMTRHPRDDFDHPLVPEGHPLRRHVLYRLRRADWAQDPAPGRAAGFLR